MPHSRKKRLEKRNSSSDQPEIYANRYEQIKKLGSGSFGTVFLISDIKQCSENKVLKKILIGNLEPDDTIGAVSEARLLAKLEHPGIVKFHDSFISGEFFCIVTEFCEGGDLEVKLHHWKKTGKQVDASLIVTWFIQLLLAVQYMHQRRVLHRDLKTRNVFLKNNMVKLGDFGISRILASTNDIATTVTGTPYYMSPELLKHEGYNAKSDIWSLGVILYEMCTLSKPFSGDSLVAVMYKIVNSDIPHLPSYFDKELQAICKRMLERDPSMRMSAGEILKTPYIVRQLKSLKQEMSLTMKGLNQTKTNREAKEIAQALEMFKKKKNIENKEDTRPMTAKEKMVLRKQERADKEAEKLKKITMNAYQENRLRCSQIKKEQSKVRVSIIEDTKSRINHSDDVINDDVIHNDVIHNDVIKEVNSYMRNGAFSPDSEEDVFMNDNSISVITLSQQHEMTPPLEKRRQYTHCFGDDDSDEDDVFDVTLIQSDDTLTADLTNVSDIPDDASVADSYYSLTADFEEDSSDDTDQREGDDYGALMEYMEDALELTENDVIGTSFDASFRDHGTASIREQKINNLRAECIKLLGKSSFERAYKYLNKVRFQSSVTKSEDEIMQHLREMVGSNTRDCFLVDQLLFLEKQNEICRDTIFE